MYRDKYFFFFSFSFPDTVRRISSNIKIDNCVEFNGRSNVSTNSKEMIFHTQEFNSFEGENNLFIMELLYRKILMEIAFIQCHFDFEQKFE